MVLFFFFFWGGRGSKSLQPQPSQVLMWLYRTEATSCFLVCKLLKGESNRTVSSGCEVILFSALCYTQQHLMHRHTCTPSPCVSILFCVCVCLRVCDSVLLYSLSLWVCMRTSRCRRRSLQPHSLESFDCRSALHPANPKTSVVLQSHTLTQTYIDVPPYTHTPTHTGIPLCLFMLYFFFPLFQLLLKS